MTDYTEAQVREMLKCVEETLHNYYSDRNTMTTDSESRRKNTIASIQSTLNSYRENIPSSLRETSIENLLANEALVLTKLLK